MIGRPVKGTGFRGVLNYLGDKEHARLLGGNMAGRNPRELAREFGILRRQRPALKRAVAHMFLRPAPGEFLSEPQWRTIASYYLAGMGFSDSPHVLYLEDEPHPHLHIVASRITYSGRVISDSNDYARSADLLRNIERSYGLRVVSAHPELPSPKPGDYNRARRTRTLPIKSHLQEVLADVSFPLLLRDYLDHLHRHGIAMLPNIARTGRVSGISYVFEGQVMKASSLGRQYTWAALAKRLVPTADDPLLLATERDHAHRSLAADDSSLPIAAGDLSAPDIGPKAQPALSAPDFARLAAAEEALLLSTPADYVDRAFEFNREASRAERFLTRALEISEPHSREAALLARGLLDSSEVQPTDRALARLLAADGLTSDFLLGRVSGAPALPDALPNDESFRQALESALGLRRELHLLELHAVALLADSTHLPAEERGRYIENATIVQNRVELARIDREIALLDFDEPGSIVAEPLRARAEELIQSTFRSQSLLASLPGPATAPITSEIYEYLLPFERWHREPTTAAAAAKAGEALAALESARTDLLTGSEHFQKRLLGYFQATDSVRDLVLDSLDPSARLSPRTDSILAGQEVAWHFLQDGPPRSWLGNRDGLDTLTQASREAFGTLLDAAPASLPALTTFIETNLSLDKVAFHVALARQELPFQKDPEELRQAIFLEVIQQRIELHAQLQERELLEILVREDSTLGYPLQLVESRVDTLQDAEYLEYLYEQPELDTSAVEPQVLSVYESWRLPPDPAATDEAAGVFAALYAVQDHVATASPEQLPERLWQYLEATEDWRLHNLGLVQSLQRGEDVVAKDPDSREYLQAARVLVSDSQALPELTPERVEQFGQDLSAARADLLNPDRSREESLERLFELRREIHVLTLNAQIAVGDLVETAASHTAEESLRYYSLLYSIELVELQTLRQQEAVARLLPAEHVENALLKVAYQIDRWEGDRYGHHLDDLRRSVDSAELANIDVESFNLHADSFRIEIRFSPEPGFFLPPTAEDIPRLADEAYRAFRTLESSTEQLRSSTPDTYLSLAIPNAAHAAVVERLDQQFATFGEYPVPRNLPRESLEAYLQTRLQFHEAKAAPPSPDRDVILDALNDRLSALVQGPPQLPPQFDGGDLAREHRRAYHDLSEVLSGRPKDLAEFREAVSHALEWNDFVQLASAHLEGRLHARNGQDALLASRLDEDSDHPPRPKLNRGTEKIQDQFYEVRLALLDRDLNLLRSYLHENHYSSSGALDRYTELLQDREILASRLEPSPAPPLSQTQQPNLATARQTLLEERSPEAFAAYERAVVHAFRNADRSSFLEAVNLVDLRRTELVQVLKTASREETSPGAAHTALRDAARGYVEARHELDDYARQPPRRGTTFDYAAHAHETSLSSSSLDRLRRSAASELRGSPSPIAVPKPPRPIEADHPGVSRSEALRLAVRRLKAKETVLEANLKGYRNLERRTPVGEKPKAIPETHRRLVGSIDAYKQALADVERLSRSRILSPLHFLRHTAFQSRPQQALASWTGYAASKGLPPSPVRGTLRSFGLSFAAGAAGRAVQHLATSFLRDQVHER